MDLKPSTAINIILSPKSEPMQSDDQFSINFDLSSAESGQAIPLENLQAGAITECWSGLKVMPEYSAWQCFNNDEFLLTLSINSAFIII